MTLNASREEFEIIRTALREYRNSLRDRSRVLCTGFSAAGIDLCVQRITVENVMYKLDELPASSRQAPIHVPVPNHLHETLSKLAARRAA